MVPADTLKFHEGAADSRLFLRLRLKWGGPWKRPSSTKWILSCMAGILIKHSKNVKNRSDEGDFKNNLVLIQQKARLSPNGQI